MTPRLSDMARCSCAPIINPLKKTLFGDSAQRIYARNIASFTPQSNLGGRILVRATEDWSLWLEWITLSTTPFPATP
ncbi:hypothetical protein LshimejAT787_0403720 [Lyophyllum shimeji]|uniref:Uncharacterized protein n=1 Tax=Lyophyllum shimeji TaxID=47721 RepID=A0A9P3PL38_LYOSH|nr:hypothetical protein LshimejAT787_0403720 [Lyophyllum shimeji]